MKNAFFRKNGPLNGIFWATLIPIIIGLPLIGCKQQRADEKKGEEASQNLGDSLGTRPDTLYRLTTDLYTADPSGHVFGDRLYVYPSHDYDAGVPEDDLGSHFAMRDYHVYSMDRVGGPVTDHGKVLDLEDVPWAGRQMWAPDVARKGSDFYLYFPAKDREDIFRIGVAHSKDPGGPFTALDRPIEGSYSMDPAVFLDNDGKYYMYFGGIWGGQLQRWTDNSYHGEDRYPGDDAPAIPPRVALMGEDMVSFAETPRAVELLGEDGRPIIAGDHERRFFEAAWVHKYGDKYYFSYSTGDTHRIVYAIGDSPYGPFTYQGVILDPVLGWTNHHSIVEFGGSWWLLFHDSSLSGGKTHLRSVKMVGLKHGSDGRIERIDALVEP